MLFGQQARFLPTYATGTIRGNINDRASIAKGPPLAAICNRPCLCLSQYTVKPSANRSCQCCNGQLKSWIHKTLRLTEGNARDNMHRALPGTVNNLAAKAAMRTLRLREGKDLTLQGSAYHCELSSSVSEFAQRLRLSSSFEGLSAFASYHN